MKTFAGKHNKDQNTVRRKKRRLKDTDISLPCEPSVKSN